MPVPVRVCVPRSGCREPAVRRPPRCPSFPCRACFMLLLLCSVQTGLLVAAFRPIDDVLTPVTTTLPRRVAGAATSRSHTTTRAARAALRAGCAKRRASTRPPGWGHGAGCSSTNRRAHMRPAAPACSRHKRRTPRTSLAGSSLCLLLPDSRRRQATPATCIPQLIIRACKVAYAFVCIAAHLRHLSLRSVQGSGCRSRLAQSHLVQSAPIYGLHATDRSRLAHRQETSTFGAEVPRSV